MRVRGALDRPFRRFLARADGGEAAKAGIAVGQRIISVSGTVRARAIRHLYCRAGRHRRPWPQPHPCPPRSPSYTPWCTERHEVTILPRPQPVKNRETVLGLLAELEDGVQVLRPLGCALLGWHAGRARACDSFSCPSCIPFAMASKVTFMRPLYISFAILHTKRVSGGECENVLAQVEFELLQSSTVADTSEAAE